MRITHEIYKCQLTGAVDLLKLSAILEKCVYTKTPFHSIQWKKYGGNFQLFSSSKIVCHGKELDKYLEELRGLGYAVRPNSIELVTKSATHRLSGRVDYYRLVGEMPGVEWHPELFHAPMLKRDGISYIIYQSGKTVITGIKTEDDAEAAMGVLLELELCL